VVGKRRCAGWMDVKSLKFHRQHGRVNTRTCEGFPLRPVSQILLIRVAGLDEPTRTCAQLWHARRRRSRLGAPPMRKEGRKEALPSPPPLALSTVTPQPSIERAPWRSSQSARKSSPNILTSTPPRSSFQRETPDSCTHMPQSVSTRERVGQET
jgi:hypothetical protein